MFANEGEALSIFRQLTLENKADFLSWVNLAHVAESSARKSLGFTGISEGGLLQKPREYSCIKCKERRRKE